MNTLHFTPTTVSIDLGGTPISIETGRIAKQANGSVIVRQGDTMVLVAVCRAEPREGIDFFPLTVDYREPVFSAGKIPGGWFKREGKQTTKETLTSRLIDRPLRPLFEEGYNGDTMITVQVISFDGEHQPDTLGMVGASAALIISEIPFHNPVGGVRVGRVNGQFVVNPTVSQRPVSDLDLLVAGTDEALVMVECGALEFQEADMVKALEFGHSAIKTLVKLQQELRAKVGKTKIVPVKPERNEEIYKQVAAKYAEKLLAALTMKVKIESYQTIDALKKEVVADLAAEKPELKKDVVESFDLLKETIFRNAILKQGARLDGRKFDQIRPLNIEVGVLPAAHGSCLFTRGETQALVTATLGTAENIQTIDGIEDEIKKSFYLHYNFPGYSVGECKPNRGPGRREIGHGMLAERSIAAMLPGKEENP
jgi:polyribonucleotide nucleotidyltransferase